MNKREYLSNLQSLSNKSKINEFSLADAMGLIGIGNSPTDPSDKINKRKKELEAKGAPTSFEAPTPSAEPTTSINTSKTASDGGVINVAGARGDGESNQKALKAGLDNINRQRQAGEISAKDAADYRAQLSDRAGAAIGEVEQQEKESAVEKGLDRVADVAEFIPGAGQGVAALHALSYGAREAMYGDEDGKYRKGAIQSGINAVLPSVLGAAGKVATKGLGLAAAGAGKVAPTAVGKVAQATTAVGEKLAGAGTSVGGAVERAAEKVIGTNATALGAAALKAPGNAVGSMAGAYGGYEAAKEADLGLVGTAAAVIGGGIVGGKVVGGGNKALEGTFLGKVRADPEGSIARNLGRVVGGAARGVNDAAGKIPVPSMPSLPSLPAGVRNKIGAVAVAASQLLPAGGAQAASRIGVPQAATAISAVERGVGNAERVSVAERVPETAPRAAEKVPERAPENAPTSSERATERAPENAPTSSERAPATSNVQAKVEANAKQTLINNSKAAETNPVIDTAPAPAKAPAPDKVPAADKAPVADKAPAADKVRAADKAPVREPVREPTRDTKPSKPTTTTTGPKTPVATPSSELSGEPVGGADDSFAGKQFGYTSTIFGKAAGVVGDSTQRNSNRESKPSSPLTRKLIPRPQLENFNMKKTIKDKIKAKLNSAKNIGKDGY